MTDSSLNATLRQFETVRVEQRGRNKGVGMFFARLSSAIAQCRPLVFREAPFVSHW
jgi:hypothetical protein